MPPNHGDEVLFEALFKPVQDISKNWDLDLSLHLEEYINYIRQICSENIPDMNFAQAAVLLQNSANIYSKKVDFLSNSVMQLVAALSKKHCRGTPVVVPTAEVPHKKGRRSEAKNKESVDQNGGQQDGIQQGGRKRKQVVILDTEEFLPLDKVCSDSDLSLNFKKEKQKAGERKKQKIVLNAAVKVRAKEKTCCNVYHCGQDVMGKKDEFRLNWRICSTGTLHEEFVVSKNKFQVLEPVEISVCINGADGDASFHNYDDGCPSPTPLEPVAPLATSLLTTAPAPNTIDRESENRFGEVRNKAGKEVKVDVKEIGWHPNDFDVNLPEKPIKKRKVIKMPPGLDDDKKRKHNENHVFSFTITDVLVDQYKNTSFYRDLDFGFQSKNAAKMKRQLLLQYRNKYQAYMEREAGQEQVDEFPGFYNEHDSDNENDFEGFGGDDAHDPLDIDVPLPETENILGPQSGEPGWKGDDANTYDNEAMKTLEAYRSRKIDHGRMSDMARRVEEWHEKITPKLEAAEHRSSFDIHEYGSKVLNTFEGKIGCIKQFEEIVTGQTREEVARYFLATLVLANQYNVEIFETEPGDLNVDCVQLKLLSVVRHYEELDDNLRQTSDK